MNDTDCRGGNHLVAGKICKSGRCEESDTVLYLEENSAYYDDLVDGGGEEGGYGHNSSHNDIMLADEVCGQPNGYEYIHQGECWYLGELGESCKVTCARVGSVPDPNYFPDHKSSNVEALLYASNIAHSHLLRQDPWAQQECYVPNENRYHAARLHLNPELSAEDWKYPICKLACRCSKIKILKTQKGSESLKTHSECVNEMSNMCIMNPNGTFYRFMNYNKKNSDIPDMVRACGEMGQTLYQFEKSSLLYPPIVKKSAKLGDYHYSDSSENIQVFTGELNACPGESCTIFSHLSRSKVELNELRKRNSKLYSKIHFFANKKNKNYSKKSSMMRRINKFSSTNYSNSSQLSCLSVLSDLGVEELEHIIEEGLETRNYEEEVTKESRKKNTDNHDIGYDIKQLDVAFLVPVTMKLTSPWHGLHSLVPTFNMLFDPKYNLHNQENVDIFLINQDMKRDVEHWNKMLGYDTTEFDGKYSFFSRFFEAFGRSIYSQGHTRLRKCYERVVWGHELMMYSGCN